MEYTGERLVLAGQNVPEDICQEHLGRYRFAKSLVKGKKVLDIACGTGYGSRMLMEAGAVKVVGADIAKEVIEKNTRENKNSNLNFVAADALELPFSDGQFEVVVSLETIEHLSNPEKFIQEIARVLQPAGQLILSTPNSAATKQLGIVNPFHIKEFEKEELIELVTRYFSSVEVRGQRLLKRLDRKQQIIQKMYFLYTKIKWLEFLKRWFPTRAKQAIGQQINGLEGEFGIGEIEPDQEYLYFVVVGKKK